VGQGTANISATVSGNTLRATSAITVTAPTNPFQITAGDMSFTHTVGATTCPQEIGSFTVTNNTTANATVRASGAAQLDYVPPAGSVGVGSLTTTVGPGASVIRVRFNCSSATPFSNTITVDASNAQGSATQTFKVTGTFSQSAPAIALSAYAQTFSSTAGTSNAASRTVSVTNGGSGTLSGLTASITYRPGDPATGWLSVGLSSTTAPATLTVTATTGSRPAGSYSAVILLRSPLVTGETALYVNYEVGVADPGGVNGRNVTKVSYTGCDFLQVGPKSWTECGRFNFAELQRDDWSVYLFDAGRGVYMQLDLFTKIAYYSDTAGTPKRPQYAITSSASLITGPLLTRVGYGSLGGTNQLCDFRQVSLTAWVDCGQFNFAETGRDDWSVYLRDASRGIDIQLDVFTKIVSFSNATTPKSSLYTILKPGVGGLP
jgi:hypothetical protein